MKTRGKIDGETYKFLIEGDQVLIRQDQYCLVPCGECDCEPPIDVLITQEINAEVIKDIRTAAAQMDRLVADTLLDSTSKTPRDHLAGMSYKSLTDEGTREPKSDRDCRSPDSPDQPYNGPVHEGS